MSMELFNAALKSDIDTAPKIAVMMVLASAADDSGVCWPSVEYLIDTTRLGRSTVLRSLSELEHEGYLRKQRRRSKSTVYTIVRERLEPSGKSQSGTSHSGTIVPERDVPQRDKRAPKVPERDVGKSHSGTVLKGTTKRTTNTSENPEPEGEPEPHPEARKLCEQLAGRMVDNGCKQPTVSKAWLTEARLLLDKDGRGFDEAAAVLDWCQADQFWRKNIQSMPKFREKYDRLRMATQDAGQLTPKATAPSDPDGITEWIREQWRQAAVSAIEQATGLRYEPPDLPLHISTKADAETFQRQHRQQWIADHHDQITHRLAKGDAA